MMMAIEASRLETNLRIPTLASLMFLLLFTFHIHFSNRLLFTENSGLQLKLSKEDKSKRVWWLMPVLQYLGGRHERIDANSRSIRGMHQGPILKKVNQTNVTKDNNKTRGDKQASVQCHVQLGSGNLPQVSKRGRQKQ